MTRKSKPLSLIQSYTWEFLLSILIVIAVIVAANLSPFYLNFDQIAYSMQQAIAIVGILGLGFMFVIILGEIDISLPAILAIGTILFARLSQSGVPLAIALPIVLASGLLAGVINGVLVVTFNVPSLAVTLGTMSAYRAIALLIGGNQGYAAEAFQPSYIWLGGYYLFNRFPVSLGLLLLLFIACWVVMHKTVFGRLLYAAGNNRIATRFSGHNVNAIVISAYAAAGALSGLAALVFVGQFESARADNASQMLLFVVACVVLGGFEITGGKGNVIGLLLSLLLIGTIQNGMGLANVPGPVQTLVIGLILIGALLLPVLIRRGTAVFRQHAFEDERQAETSAAPDQSIRQEQSGRANQEGARATDVPRLRLQGITKHFGGILALKDVSFDVMPGEIHALVGENGAGKSTLVKIITGIHAADSGEMLVDAVPAAFDSPMEARQSGVLAVYQDPKLFPNLDVAENIFMGVHPVTSLGTVDRKKMYTRAREVLKSLNVDLDLHAAVAGLSTAEMQFVEFARAMYDEGERFLILDEPTASLTPGETERLFETMRHLKARGTSILFISHRLEELEGLVDRITVLRDGRHVTTKPARELTQSEIVKLMVGRSLETLYGDDGAFAEGSVQDKAAQAEDTDNAVLRVEELGQFGVFDNISFSVYPGEVVGLAGLVGAGRSEIAQTLFGITPPSLGRVVVDGQLVSAQNPRHMLNHGVAYVPEDREQEGLINQLSILRNMVLPSVGTFSKFGIVDQRRERAVGEAYAQKLQVKSAGLDAPVSSLSGGNRQKVVLTKWLAMTPKLLILDEPTHGIDVGTKAQVHQMITELAAQGMGILMISSDLPEILRMSDRILVIADGRLAAEFSRNEATSEKIMMAAAIGKGGVLAE